MIASGDWNGFRHAFIVSFNIYVLLFCFLLILYHCFSSIDLNLQCVTMALQVISLIVDNNRYFKKFFKCLVVEY